MAYLREIETKCKRCRTARAVVELIDRWNGSRGEYCRKCGAKELAAQNARENPLPAPPPPEVRRA
jgi:hypothetical protein